MSNWTVNFIYAIMIIILIQFLSPEGKFDKHIKLAASLMFVIAVFIPVLEIIKNGDIESEYLKESLVVDTAKISYTSSNAQSAYKSSLLTNYKTNLLSSINTQLKNGIDFEGSVSIVIEEDENKESFGSILRVEITSKSEINEQKAKKILNDFYNINEDNIYISVNK